MKRYRIGGSTARAIAESVEEAIRAGRLAPGQELPTVRALAAELGVSPATVASAWSALRARGLLSTRGRAGTRVSARPPLPSPPERPVPERLRNLADGNPDPELLPALGPALSRLDRRSRLYGAAPDRSELVALARERFEADAVPADHVAVVGGALDGIERVLQSRLQPGDRVVVEDPAHSGVLDLLAALGLVIEPVGVDDQGFDPAALRTALATRPRALVVTPRAQSPTGAALSARRAGELRRELVRVPELLLIEDDHAGPVAGVPASWLRPPDWERWVALRSVSKSLGPDLRLAVLAGDATTIARVGGRQLVGTGWVSHVLQGLVSALWADPRVAARLASAATVYAERRSALLEALAARGVSAMGRSGFNVWVPVPAEVAVVAALAERGWAVREGERFRVRSGPAIRVTVSTLRPAEARRFAADLAAVLEARSVTRA